MCNDNTGEYKKYYDSYILRSTQTYRTKIYPIRRMFKKNISVKYRLKFLCKKKYIENRNVAHQ